MDCVIPSGGESSKRDSYSLVCLHIVLSRLWKAKHPAHNPAAVETPTHVTNLPPSPSMLHLHHTLCDEGFPLGSHEDGTKTDLLDLHFTVTLGQTTQSYLLLNIFLGVTQKCIRGKLLYRVVVVSVEPGDLICMSVAVVAVRWMPAAVHSALPLRSRAAIGPASGGVGSAGGLILSALSGAHHPQVLRVLTVIHPPAVVFAVLQGLLCAFTVYIIHPYWALWKDKQFIT